MVFQIALRVCSEDVRANMNRSFCTKDKVAIERLLLKENQLSQVNEFNTFLCYRTYAQSLKSCPSLCNPMDCGPPGSSVSGVFQIKILEWVAISLSRVSSLNKD